MNSAEQKNGTSDPDSGMEIIIGTLLRSGVLLSAGVVLLGGVLYLSRHTHDVTNYHVFRGNDSPLRTLGGVAHGVAELSGRAIIQLGLLLLIATPIARVIFSAFAFARERDYLYVMFTLIVLVVLLYSLFEAYLH